MAKAQGVKKFIEVNGILYQEVETKTTASISKTTSSQKATPKIKDNSFQGKLNKMISFINRNKRTRKLSSMTPNGDVLTTKYTTKSGVTKKYDFEGVTKVYKDGVVEQAFYQNQPFFIKGEFGDRISLNGKKI